ncbi:hypothetical protein BVC80_1837g115 [Macleaya cordata]|uniref:Uncharacterized protein n=1 Tax=Macleaya cordata TaxID=56857 RepID=A0A200R3M4_MACCD|nr:hypothetical protein BVC80_1837g115 [Macleaya cordata]
MNRISKDYLSGGGGSGGGGGGGGGGVSKDTDENLDLFSRNRRTLDITSSVDEPDVSMKLGRLSVGSVKLVRSGMDDLLFSVDGGKHDYDWLLTPPGTPLVSSTDASEPQSAAAGPRNTSSVRSVSTTKASRLSVTQSDNNYSSRPTRSSSVTRPSISMTNYTSYSSNRSSSILNTSSASVASISRPSTPSSRSSFPSTARPSTPTARPSTPAARASRPSTPAKSRPTTTISSGDKTRTPQNARPSTPTSRTQIHANLNSLAARSNSRPSTPTGRNSAPGPPQVRGRSASVGRALTNGRNASVASRGSSPGPRARSTQHPIVLPDFPLDTPPNLRTTLPDRPISAARSRPSAANTVKGSSELPGPVIPPRRQSSSPVITRGRLPDSAAKGRLHVNGHDLNAADSQKTTPISEAAAVRRPSKPATATESTGFGRTISKKSLDMALRHMDIRNGSGSIRSLSGTTLFPQSVRSGMPKGQRARVSDPPHSISSSSNGRTPSHSYAATISDNGSCFDRSQDGETEEVDSRLSGTVGEPDIYESSRYDTILLKEDLKNTNWLHSFDDKPDMGLIFDQPFEPLPEPFDPL